MSEVIFSRDIMKKKWLIISQYPSSSALSSSFITELRHILVKTYRLVMPFDISSLMNHRCIRVEIKNVIFEKDYISQELV